MGNWYDSSSDGDSPPLEKQHRYDLRIESDSIWAKMDDELSRRRVVNGKLVRDQDPDRVRSDGSGSEKSLYQISRCTEAVPIKKTGVSIGRQVDELLNRYSQLMHPTDSCGEAISYNRKWLAAQLKVKPGDLNNALRPGAPAAAHGRAASRAVRYLTTKIKMLEKRQAKE